jgi:hypothetical protein
MGLTDRRLAVPGAGVRRPGLRRQRPGAGAALISTTAYLRNPALGARRASTRLRRQWLHSVASCGDQDTACCMVRVWSARDAGRLDSLRPEAWWVERRSPRKAEGRRFDPAPDHAIDTEPPFAELRKRDARINRHGVPPEL